MKLFNSKYKCHVDLSWFCESFTCPLFSTAFQPFPISCQKGWKIDSYAHGHRIWFNFLTFPHNLNAPSIKVYAVFNQVQSSAQVLLCLFIFMCLVVIFMWLQHRIFFFLSFLVFSKDEFSPNAFYIFFMWYTTSFNDVLLYNGLVINVKFYTQYLLDIFTL